MSKIQEKIALTEKEMVELQYNSYLGFKYIARNEIGSLSLFKEKPVRDKETNGRTTSGYDTWVIGSYPIKDHSLYGEVKLGKYDFIQWNDGVFEIDALLNPNDYSGDLELCNECLTYGVLDNNGRCEKCVE